MAGSRVAVFSVGTARRPSSFIAWASLVGPQVALLHVSKGYQQVRDQTPCRCEIYHEGVAEEAIGATVRRTAALRSAPRFVFLKTSSGADVVDLTDPRFWSPDLTKVRAAMVDFVAAEAASDPKDEPEPARIESVGRTPTGAGQGTPSLAVVGGAVFGGAAKPWWCKLFRSAPGC